MIRTRWRRLTPAAAAAILLVAGCQSSTDKQPSSPSPTPTATHSSIPGLDEQTLRTRAMQAIGVTKPATQDTEIDGQGRRSIRVHFYNRQRQTDIIYDYIPDTTKVIGVSCYDPIKTTTTVTPVIAVCLDLPWANARSTALRQWYTHTGRPISTLAVVCDIEWNAAVGADGVSVDAFPLGEVGARKGAPTRIPAKCTSGPEA